MNKFLFILILLFTSSVASAELSASTSVSSNVGNYAEVGAVVIGTKDFVIAYSAATTTLTSSPQEPIHLKSKSSASGRYVFGEGSSPEKSKISVTYETLSESLRRINVFAESTVPGFLWTFAWASDTISYEEFKEKQEPHPSVPETPAFRGGWIFGHSDVERYWHFKNQAYANCIDGSNETQFKVCQRSVYNMEVILNGHRINQTMFELKYPMKELLRVNMALKDAE